ncbi:endonuclease domain-containing protein [Armatimonas sp.]|uniref:endonuclease domain-containing protein n=1 Tax=Armatimonas sp. TaxID=1872638 RepID=UPI00286AD36F|nr:endonuclease domain-containing protein [Armatimonas sp.]
MRNRSRALRNKPTEAEKKLWEALRYDRCNGLRFLRQHVIGVYVVDFYCAGARLVIEVDGSIHDLPEIRQQDQHRQQLIEEHGFSVLRLANDEVLAKTSGQLRQSVRDFLITSRI